MAYPPSSAVSHFKMIFSISNLNDWLIVDGDFFFIRCIILLSNKTENKIKWCTYFLLIRRVVQSHEACVVLRMTDNTETRTPQLYRDKHYVTYVEFSKHSAMLRCTYALSGVIAHRESLSIRYTQHHEIGENTRSGCRTIIRDRNERTIG